jgi:hypothetical protein
MYNLPIGGDMKSARRACYLVSVKQCLVVLLALSSLLQAREAGNRVVFVGGTVSGIQARSSARVELLGSDALEFDSRAASFRIPYKDINTLEYGLRVNRRYVEAALISPVFLFSKKTSHFLTIGFVDREGKQQAMVLQVNKDDIRPLLVSLEARTGLRIDYQDEEARKAGRG